MVLSNAEIIEKINSELKNKGIKCLALAERTGIPYQVLLRRLSGNGEIKLEAEFFFKIITFLGMPLTDFIVEGDNGKNKTSA